MIQKKKKKKKKNTKKTFSYKCVKNSVLVKNPAQFAELADTGKCHAFQCAIFIFEECATMQTTHVFMFMGCVAQNPTFFR